VGGSGWTLCFVFSGGVMVLGGVCRGLVGIWWVLEQQWRSAYLRFGRPIKIILNWTLFERYPEETPGGNRLPPGNP
jgi:hypothetical protein